MAEQIEQLEQQKEPEPELLHTIIDDSKIIVIDDPTINVTKLLASKKSSHVSDWNR